MPGLSVPGALAGRFPLRGCGHDHAYTLRRHIYECAACGKQHSLLAGTIFEQTKTGLARWFLAIYLVTSSKGGISAMELQRQMGFGSYQTAWSWLHKIRKAMVGPDRKPLGRAGRGRRDLSRCGRDRAGGPRRRRQDVVAGAVEAGRGKARGRRLGRLRLAAVPDASAASLEGFLGRNRGQACRGRHRRLGRLMPACRPRATPTSPIEPRRLLG